jgi:hypothetical protein
MNLGNKQVEYVIDFMLITYLKDYILIHYSKKKVIKKSCICWRDRTTFNTKWWSICLIILWLDK